MIHQYKNNGYNIVLDVYSGAVHVVDDLCYDVIAVLNEPDEEPTAEILKSDLTWENLKKRLGDTYSEEDLRDALDDVIELTEDGKLFTKDEFEYLVPIVKKRKTSCPDELRSRQKSTGFPDRKFRKQKKSGSRFLWRRATYELAGCQRSGSIRKRTGKAS